MSWLRIDDGFSRHPKVTALTHRERWTWLDLLCYCARYQTGGYLPDNIGEQVVGATSKTLGKYGQLGLLNVVGGRLRVHDWHIYNGTITERVEFYLSMHPDATANDVHRAVGGTRDIVLAEVKRIKGGTGRTGNAGTDRTGQGGSEIGTETGSESGSHARGPVLPKSSPRAVNALRPAEPPTAEPNGPRMEEIRRQIHTSLEEAS